MQPNSGRCLGLIAGLGPEATVHYYRSLLRAHEARQARMRLTMIQADMPRVVDLVRQDAKQELADYFAGLISSLKAGGAEIAAIPAVTPHLCRVELEAVSPLPLVDILSAVRAELEARKLRRVAIFGTRFTIESALFGELGETCVVTPEST